MTGVTDPRGTIEQALSRHGERRACAPGIAGRGQRLGEREPNNRFALLDRAELLEERVSAPRVIERLAGPARSHEDARQVAVDHRLHRQLRADERAEQLALGRAELALRREDRRAIRTRRAGEPAIALR